jgi:predicted cupin superfamily sugar epimerase
MPTVDQVKTILRLQPLLGEGGYYAESYRADETIASSALPGRYDGPRAHGTAIYYLLEPDTFSALHRLRSDEVYHFYLGSPLEMLLLWPEGKSQVLLLGPDIATGMQVQVVVPRGVWQGSRLLPGGDYALLGTTMAPGFDPADYEGGSREELVGAYPRERERILGLTRG